MNGDLTVIRIPENLNDMTEVFSSTFFLRLACEKQYKHFHDPSYMLFKFYYICLILDITFYIQNNNDKNRKLYGSCYTELCNGGGA